MQRLLAANGPACSIHVYKQFPRLSVLRIEQAPQVDVHILPSTVSPGGMGEAGVALMALAVASAVFAASGARVRGLPIDPQRRRKT